MRLFTIFFHLNRLLTNGKNTLLVSRMSNQKTSANLIFPGQAQALLNNRYSFANPPLFLLTKLALPPLSHRLCTDFAPTLVRRIIGGRAELLRTYIGAAWEEHKD